MVGIRAAVQAASAIRQVIVNYVLYDCEVTHSLESLFAPSCVAEVPNHQKEQYLSTPHHSLQIQQPRARFVNTGKHHHDSSRRQFVEDPYFPDHSLQSPDSWNYASQAHFHPRIPVEGNRIDFPMFEQNFCFSSSDDSNSADHIPVSRFHQPKKNWNTMVRGNSFPASIGHYFHF
jgi:hypothetical protein